MVCVYEKYMIQENNLLFRKPPLLGPPLSLPKLLFILCLLSNTLIIQ